MMKHEIRNRALAIAGVTLLLGMAGLVGCDDGNDVETETVPTTYDQDVNNDLDNDLDGDVYDDNSYDEDLGEDERTDDGSGLSLNETGENADRERPMFATYQEDADGNAQRRGGIGAMEFAGNPIEVTPNLPQQVRAGEPTKLEYIVRNTSERPARNVVLITATENFHSTSGQTAQNQQHQTGQQQNAQANQSQNRQGNLQTANQTNRNQGQQNLGEQSQGLRTTRHSIGELGPGEEQVVTVQGVPSREGQMRVCAMVEADAYVCSTARVVKPELRMTCQIVNEQGQPVQGPVYVCDPVYLQYTVTNEGTGVTQPVRIEEELPQGLMYEADRMVVANIEPLQGGETRELDLIPLKADQQMTLEGCGGTATTGDLKAQATGESTIRFIKPQLELTINGPDRGFPERELQYEFTVRNISDYDAINTMLAFEGIDAEDREIGRLEAGESRSVRITADPARVGTMNVSATANAFCADAVEATIATEIRGIPALQISVVDESDTFDVDQQFDYYINVLNEGTAKDLNITMQATLPEGMQFVRSEGPTNVTGKSGQLTFEPLSKLDVGDEATWIVTVVSSQPGKFQRFEVLVNSDSLNKPLRIVEPTTIY